MLETWAVSVDEFTQVASANLALALSSSKVEYSEIQNVKRGFFETELPIKSPLLLAPNLKEVVETIVGWPLQAVIPDQDFIYIWPAADERFCERVGAVVLREYSTASHPVTTELLRIDDDGIQALGNFA